MIIRDNDYRDRIYRSLQADLETALAYVSEANRQADANKALGYLKIATSKLTQAGRAIRSQRNAILDEYEDGKLRNSEG